MLLKTDSALALGYNTNGFAYHRLSDAIEIIAALGYTGVALSLDVHHADPSRFTASDWQALGQRLAGHGLAVVIETGARYLLDPARKHHPTLLAHDAAARAVRRRFIHQALEAAVHLGAPVVSLWSGSADPEDGAPEAVWERLVGELRALAEQAEARGLRLGFEPEPGMLVETLGQYRRLANDVAHRALGLTLDVGHCQCVENAPLPALIREHAGDLVNVQLDDMCRGIHEHLAFGAGEIDFPPVLKALIDAEFDGLCAVELSAHSRNAVGTARESFAFLKRAAQRAGITLGAPAFGVRPPDCLKTQSARVPPRR